MYDDSKKNNKKIIIVICIVLFIGFLIFHEFITFPFEYNSAWQYLYDGKYDQAEWAFDYVAQNYDTFYMYHSGKMCKGFSKACQLNDEGDYRNAQIVLDLEVIQEKDSPYRLSKKQAAFMNEKIAAINENYNAHKAEYDAEDQKKQAEYDARKKKEEEEEAARKQAAPYVGLAESKIDTTDIGKHSEYIAHFNIQWIKGERYQTSMYYWYQGGDCIYSARCVNGKVYNITDNRDHHLKNNKPNHTTTKSKSKKKEQKTTEFDPDDHDIEQYYEDYKDEFEDIDDAYDDFEDNPEYWDDY